MKKKTLKYCSILATSLLILTACNNSNSSSKNSINQQNSSNSQKNEDASTSTTEFNIDDLTNPNDLGITLPPEPTEEQASATLTGIDTNNNQVRDDIEHTIYQAISLSDPPITANEYQQALDMIKYIQPTNDPNQLIDQHTFYCKYTSLPETFKNELSMSFLQYLVTDTKDRGDSFYKKLIKSSSTGEEVCTQ